MSFFEKINRALSGLEWRWSLGAFIWGAIFPASSFALPAWATRATGVFADYGPLSWVIAGFTGLILYALAVALYGYGMRHSVRSRYDAKFMRASGGVDPLAKVFEGKRIFLNDFALPSHPIVDGKNFVDCEIVGPANIYLEDNNNIKSTNYSSVDAVALSGERVFSNGYLFRNCTFVNCTFHRVTLFIKPEEVPTILHLNWLNWISPLPAQPELPGTRPQGQIEDKREAEENAKPEASPEGKD
ncbi:hypothetical protein [Sulfitobacter mediterraneus]|uniref:Uncharacterized protein n=1 Tax=Sulfitobacter mediterraneus TaxID=83219 RepID=A0A061SQA7_9RHOB|nr:hypothetical protein [Sulfitobacter mediterraneus]KAJ01818.1 hypothetical protein PM02_17535 [Sulfitobacter mediterraneus]